MIKCICSLTSQQLGACKKVLVGTAVREQVEGNIPVHDSGPHLAQPADLQVVKVWPVAGQSLVLDEAGLEGKHQT